MGGLILKRLPAMLATLLIVSFLTFLLTSLLPGDPAIQILGADNANDENSVAVVRQELRLDDPLLVRYGAWLEVAIDELATAIIMRRLARSRPEHDAMTEGRETFPTARFLDLLRFSRATGAGLMKGSRK